MCLQYFFYTGPLCASGPGAARSPRPPRPHRAPPPPAPRTETRGRCAGSPGARPTARQLPVYLAHVRFPPPPATPLFPFSLKRRPVGRKGSSKCDCH
ncbi:uncharacterized protein [Manis javanica]|uniref:uncharacterized protein n=1 Tax=Manis javanica TaxID=9974 RepID=UPI003C6D0DD3